MPLVITNATEGFTAAAGYAEHARRHATGLTVPTLDSAVACARTAIEIASSLPNGAPSTDQLFTGLELLKVARRAPESHRTGHVAQACIELGRARDTLLSAAAAAR